MNFIHIIIEYMYLKLEFTRVNNFYHREIENN